MSPCDAGVSPLNQCPTPLRRIPIDVTKEAITRFSRNCQEVSSTLGRHRGVTAPYNRALEAEL